MGGKSGYSGPTETDLIKQKEAYRAQWDQEREKEDLQNLQDENNYKKRVATNELKSRRGVSDVLTSAIGFTKKSNKDEDEDELGV